MEAKLDLNGPKNKTCSKSNRPYRTLFHRQGPTPEWRIAAGAAAWKTMELSVVRDQSPWALGANPQQWGGWAERSSSLKSMCISLAWE